MLANLKLFYGQLALGDEEYELARQMFEGWLATTMQVADSSQLFSAAYANYMTQHLDEAEKLVDQAISRNAAAPDSWHRLHYQVLFDLERYNAAELILLDLLERTPANEGHWRLLANHHLRREDSVKALAALTIAKQIEVLADIEDLLRIVSLFNVAEAPERGARMLEKALESNSAYLSVEIPADVYGTDAPGTVIGVNNMLIAPNSMDADVVEKITAAIFDARLAERLAAWLRPPLVRTLVPDDREPRVVELFH